MLTVARQSSHQREASRANEALYLPLLLGQAGEAGQALTHGLEDVAEVEPWTTVLNPGVSTLDRLVELTREVEFAAFVFGQDDWTSNPSDARTPGQASPNGPSPC